MRTRKRSRKITSKKNERKKRESNNRAPLFFPSPLFLHVVVPRDISHASGTPLCPRGRQQHQLPCWCPQPQEHEHLLLQCRRRVDGIAPPHRAPLRLIRHPGARLRANPGAENGASSVLVSRLRALEKGSEGRGRAREREAKRFEMARWWWLLPARQRKKKGASGRRERIYRRHALVAKALLTHQTL